MVDIDQLEETECMCTTCQNMCAKFSCWGTPEEIERLINEGYSDKLYCVAYYSHPDNIYILAPKPKGFITWERIKVGPKYGECEFLTDDRLCSLHNKKVNGHRLKPMEGRLVDHNSQRGVDDPHDAIAEMWDSEFAKDLVNKWLNNEI